MLSKQQRLTTLEHVKLQENVLLKKKRGNYFSLFLYKTKNSTKASVVVSSKVHKNAAKRNQLRRFTYILLSTYLPLFKNTIVIIRSLPSAKTATKKDLKDDLHNLFKSIPQPQ